MTEEASSEAASKWLPELAPLKTSAFSPLTFPFPIIETQEQRLLDTNDELGMVWLPPGRHVLGADAARLLRPHLLESVTPHHKRQVHL